MAAIHYFRRLYATYGGYILLSAAVYYFPRLYITFDGYILLLALPDCDFVRIQDFITISCTYGLKAKLDFNINLLALIQFFFLTVSVVQCSLLEILFYYKYSNAGNAKFCSPCATNGSQGK